MFDVQLYDLRMFRRNVHPGIKSTAGADTRQLTTAVNSCCIFISHNNDDYFYYQNILDNVSLLSFRRLLISYYDISVCFVWGKIMTLSVLFICFVYSQHKPVWTITTMMKMRPRPLFPKRREMIFLCRNTSYTPCYTTCYTCYHVTHVTLCYTPYYILHILHNVTYVLQWVTCYTMSHHVTQCYTPCYTSSFQQRWRWFCCVGTLAETQLRERGSVLRLSHLQGKHFISRLSVKVNILYLRFSVKVNILYLRLSVKL